MLDLIGALLMGATLVAELAILIGLAAIRPGARLAAYVIAAVWVSIVFGIAAVGGFAPGATGPFPPPVLAFLVLMISGIVAWSIWPSFRDAFLRLPLAALVGINAFRIGGACFLILHNQGRLAAPFSTSAGWGDIITGIAAIPVAAMAASKGKLPRWLLTSWNAFGALDLIAAIALGALSAPGTPFHIFRDAPGTLAMATIPWVGVPALHVPLFLMTHLAIAVRIRMTNRGQAITQQDFRARRAA